MISQEVSRANRFLISGEIILIFAISIGVSFLRLNQDLIQVLISYPGQPKILIFPLIWYLFLYVNDGWDKSKFLASNKYYSDVLDSALKSLIVFAAVAYLIDYPISRIWVIYNIVAISTSLLL